MRNIRLHDGMKPAVDGNVAQRALGVKRFVNVLLAPLGLPRGDVVISAHARSHAPPASVVAAFPYFAR